MKIVNLSAVCLCVVSASAAAADLVVPMNKVSAVGIGEEIGTIAISERGDGIVLKFALSGIPDGEHGFHLHETGDCGPGTKDGKPQAALAAGPHYDPSASKSHKGPGGSGHMGDLPLLKSADGSINTTLDLVHLKMAAFEGRALMIHEGGDNYSDQPENGGGKGRIACGVVPKS
jgi:superoxide dismutase, Cu-Zn family